MTREKAAFDKDAAAFSAKKADYDKQVDYWNARGRSAEGRLRQSSKREGKELESQSQRPFPERGAPERHHRRGEFPHRVHQRHRQEPEPLRRAVQYRQRLPAAIPSRRASTRATAPNREIDILRVLEQGKIDPGARARVRPRPRPRACRRSQGHHVQAQRRQHYGARRTPTWPRSQPCAERSRAFAAPVLYCFRAMLWHGKQSSKVSPHNLNQKSHDDRNNQDSD